MKTLNSAIVGGLMVAFLASEAVSGDGVDAVEEAAASMPRGLLGVPSQWFEMESLVGWEKMMLIFGYADDASVCQHLLEIAELDAPARNFRCTPAN